MKYFLLFCLASCAILQIVFCEDGTGKVDCFDEEKMKERHQQFREDMKKCNESSNGDREEFRKCMDENRPKEFSEDEFNFETFLSKGLDDFTADAPKDKIESKATECYNTFKTENEGKEDREMMRGAHKCFMDAVKEYCNRPKFGPRGPRRHGRPGGLRDPPPEEQPQE